MNCLLCGAKTSITHYDDYDICFVHWLMWATSLGMRYG